MVLTSPGSHDPLEAVSDMGLLHPGRPAQRLMAHTEEVNTSQV